MNAFICCYSNEISIRTDDSAFVKKMNIALRELIANSVNDRNYEMAREYINMLLDLEAAVQDRKEYIKKQMQEKEEEE